MMNEYSLAKLQFIIVTFVAVIKDIAQWQGL